jgi:hypothetical protein
MCHSAGSRGTSAILKESCRNYGQSEFPYFRSPVRHDEVMILLRNVSNFQVEFEFHFFWCFIPSAKNMKEISPACN